MHLFDKVLVLNFLLFVAASSTHEESNIVAQENLENKSCDKKEMCDIESKVKTCVDFDGVEQFQKDSRSIFMMTANGRMGNHMIAYSLMKQLNRELNVRTFIRRETKEMLSAVFEESSINVPVLEEVFCNPYEVSIKC